MIYAANWLVSICILICVAVCAVNGADAAANSTVPDQEVLRQGELLYRNGILPSGEAVQAYVKGDLPVSGTAFSCSSCHLRAGLGSVEGGVFTPPTTGLQLYQPFRLLFKGLEQRYYPIPDLRPAYNDFTLAEAIKSGVAPDGRRLNDVMPRYLLEDSDMSTLITYLKSLSAQYSPGVSESVIRFATIVTDGVPSELRNAMLVPLQQYTNIKNSQSMSYRTSLGKKSRQMAENMMVSKELSTRQISLSVWELKGAPETWRRQLDDYYRKEPVFALIGGISHTNWDIIHAFSEANKLPCLLPQTDLPVVSDSNWYTLYPSKGFYQEGESAARFTGRAASGTNGHKIIQIVRDSREGRALAQGADQAKRDNGEQPVTTIYLRPGEVLSDNNLTNLLKKEQPDTIFVWDTASASAPLLEMLSSSKYRPKAVFVSYRYFGGNLELIPEKARDYTFITYPYSFAKAPVPSAMGGSILVEDESRLSVKYSILKHRDTTFMSKNLSESVTQIMTMALMDMRGSYYRDNFFDVIGMIADQPSQSFARLSFGPGQRYASKGCYIVQLTSGTDPDLIKKSSWVIH